MVCFGCGVAPMWPEPICENASGPTDHGPHPSPNPRHEDSSPFHRAGNVLIGRAAPVQSSSTARRSSLARGTPSFRRCATSPSPSQSRNGSRPVPMRTPPFDSHRSQGTSAETADYATTPSRARNIRRYRAPLAGTAEVHMDRYRAAENRTLTPAVVAGTDRR
jgi:hypothetical protein